MPRMQPLIITIDGPARDGQVHRGLRVVPEVGPGVPRHRGDVPGGADRLLRPAGASSRPPRPTRRPRIADTTELRFDWNHQPPRLYASGADVTDELRHPAVSERVSDLAVIPAVRDVLVRRQQQIASQHPRLVSRRPRPGLDRLPQSAVQVLPRRPPRDSAPNAASTRSAKAEAKSSSTARSSNTLNQRDRKDTSRSQGPLICPDDAVRVDTTDLTADQVIDKLQAHIESRLKNPIEDQSRRRNPRPDAPTPVPAPNSEQS